MPSDPSCQDGPAPRGSGPPPSTSSDGVRRTTLRIQGLSRLGVGCVHEEDDVHRTVRQVSEMTGIAPDTLRAWERRYGVVTPARSESRYRLYDEHDIERLQLMARLVSGGAPASLAAQQVAASLPDDRSEHAGPGPGGGASSAEVEPRPTTSPAVTDPGLDALVVAARNLDRAEVDRVLDRAFSTGSFESVAEQWLLPALAEVGAAWSDGRIDVAGEHLVSGVVRGRLGSAYDAAGSALGGPVVLVGLPPGSRHELGSLTFATCLRRLGGDVRWLGADLPVDSWSHAVARLRPAAVVITVPTGADLAAASEVTGRLRGEHPALPIFAGGGGTGHAADALRSSAVLDLPGSVTRAAREVMVHLQDTLNATR
ncbi:MerR family transcriptional regulator [Ornithinimicrobium avium]|uniref:MerR family transcriptional regulator n=1 Tax=Ornithinimicrobium avium TaxID=2283195 RepID=A0A345NPR9_9MICO|nr:MerR family transcriptional regulator [Ornithinimicrobium avium]AXH97027.1 MerR family transcriptional regulator [Ornithinimicrobium avium]